MSEQRLPSLLRVDEAGRLVFPDKPPCLVRRQLYRWVGEGVIPAQVILRDGRAIWFRRELLLAWASGRKNGDAVD